MLKMPKGITLEKLTFGDVLNSCDEILKNSSALKVSLMGYLCAVIGSCWYLFHCALSVGCVCVNV